MKLYLSIFFSLLFAAAASAQGTDSLLQNGTLQNCVQYALGHQPVIKQSQLDEEITERQIRTKLADWYPQVNLAYNIQHNFQVQTNIIGGNPVKLGVNNTSYAQFGLTQTIFNRDVLLARRTAADIRTQAKQNTTSNKIDVTVNVSKAFYGVLLTQQQIDLDNETIVRLERSLKDAFNQYNGGIVDKIDYKRATISLNNAKAQKKQDEENLAARTAVLKSLMGYPPTGKLDLNYDSTQLERDAVIDTNQALSYDTRIEYQLLQTQKKLQASNLSYYKWGYLPSLSAFGNYKMNFLNNDFGKLYSQNFPNSFAGLTLAFPIFQRGKRTQQIRQAELQLERVDYDIINLKNNINASYEQAIAAYKGYYNYFTILKDNLAIANEVYGTVQLQYKAGIKTYLDVIFAETDLRSAQVNYSNALFQVLSSKLDVQRELGSIQY